MAFSEKVLEEVGCQMFGGLFVLRLLVVGCGLFVVGCLLLVDMQKAAFQKLRVYRLSEEIADQLWSAVILWTPFSRETIGRQLVRAADSIGANIAEGFGRGVGNDNKRFVRVARGSLNETIHFLRQSYRRNLITKEQSRLLRPLLDELGPKLNAYLKSIGQPKALQQTTNNKQQTTFNQHPDN